MSCIQCRRWQSLYSMDFRIASPVFSIYGHLSLPRVPFLSQHIEIKKLVEELFSLLKFAIGFETLQNLNYNKVASCEGQHTQISMQVICLFVLNSIEIINPHGRIDQSHASLCISSRSPSQRSFPRNSFNWFCPFNLISNSRAYSTVALLLDSLERFCASFIRASSITILVLMCIFYFENIHLFTFSESEKANLTLYKLDVGLIPDHIQRYNLRLTKSENTAQKRRILSG